MNRMAGVLVVIGLAVAATAGWWLGRASAPAGGSSDAAQRPPAREVLYYRNPMGLADTSSVPKKDSMGMDYIPVYAGDGPEAAVGSVLIAPEKVQLLGVRTAIARRGALLRSLRVSAAVQVDETREFAIAPRFTGWVRTLHASQTGMLVRRGQALASVYSPELLAAQNEYRIASAAANRLQPGDPGSAATMRALRDAAGERLRNWDVVALPATDSDFVLVAPADAVLISKSVVQGDRFESGQTILRLADLTRVWIVAQVPSSSSSMLTLGAAAQFSTPSLPGRVFRGNVGFIQPVVDLATRSIGVRLEIANTDGALRPGLYGDLTLAAAPTADAVLISVSSVIDSGTRQVALVQVAPGHFEPRQLTLGERGDEEVSVLSGIESGELVVVSGNFLIDAESNLRSALQGLSAAPASDKPTHSAPAERQHSTPEADAAASEHERATHAGAH